MTKSVHIFQEIKYNNIDDLHDKLKLVIINQYYDLHIIKIK